MGDSVIFEFEELPPKYEYKENEYPKLFINKMSDGSGYRISWEESPWERSSWLIAKKIFLENVEPEEFEKAGD